MGDWELTAILNISLGYLVFLGTATTMAVVSLYRYNNLDKQCKKNKLLTIEKINSPNRGRVKKIKGV